MNIALEKNGVYRATISLDFIESFADDDYIATIFKEYGFGNVTVTGDGEDRVATGVWEKDDVTLDIGDSHIVKIVKLS